MDRRESAAMKKTPSGLCRGTGRAILYRRFEKTDPGR